ncbi:unnamed protein product [Darwinula stevensoni]|uniref:Uncharacterized protein n=1 Tax=Darwinula stevensoni TaxID=69355 RepID=A0A7R9FPW3_9CRUS|nr:unnamed protein product [Darwinula stevensoni]CAG0898569.1 unnamed protein product [Darwinula stevensoni]
MSVCCVASGRGGSLAASGGEDGRIILTQIPSGMVEARLDHHRGGILHLEIDPQNDILVAGSADQTLSIWSLDTSFHLLNDVSLNAELVSLAVSPDSIFLLAACSDDVIYVVSLATGTFVRTLHKITTSHITGIYAAEDSKRAAICYQNGLVGIFDYVSGKEVEISSSGVPTASSVCGTAGDKFLFIAGGNGVSILSFVPPGETAHSQEVTCIDMTSDGSLLVSGSKDGQLKVWRWPGGDHHSTLVGHGKAVNCVSFAPNALFLVSGSLDHSIRVWSLTLGLHVRVMKAHENSVEAVKVFPDSRRVVSADNSGTVIIWRSDTLTQLASFRALHLQLGVTKDARYVVCSSLDSSIPWRAIGVAESTVSPSLQVCPLLNPEKSYRVSHKDAILCWALSPDCLRLITGSADTSLKVWNLDGGKLEQIATMQMKDSTRGVEESA